MKETFAVMIRIISMIISMVLVFALPAAAQGADAQPRLRFNVVVEVDPNRIEEFEAAWRTIRDQAEQEDFGHYTVVAENRNRRLITSVIGDYANLRDIHEFVARYSTSKKTKVKEAINTLLETTTSASSYVIDYDTDLTYMPPGSYAGPFHERKTLYFDVRDREKIALLLARQRDLWAAAEIPHAFYVYWHGVGSGASSVTIRTSASDRAIHRKNFQSVESALDAEQSTALTNDFDAVIRSQSIVNWVGRAELNVTPEYMREQED